MEIIKLPDTKFINNNNRNIVNIAEIEVNDEGTILTYVYEGREGKYRSYSNDFFKHFKPLKTEEENPKNNLNQDITKLIESGYKFKSFSATTVDGRYINVDLEEDL